MISFILVSGALYFGQAIIFIFMVLFIAMLLKILKLNKNKEFYNNIFSNEFKLYIVLVVLFLFSLIIAILFIYNLMQLFNFNVSKYIFIIYGLIRISWFIFKKDSVITTIKKYF